MGIIWQAISVILTVLIAIGDGITFIVTETISSVLRVYAFTASVLQRTTAWITRIFNATPQKRKRGRPRKHLVKIYPQKNKYWLGQNSLSILHLIARIVSDVTSFGVKFLIFITTLFRVLLSATYRIFFVAVAILKKIFRRRSAHKKRKRVASQLAYRPSLLYKMKYVFVGVFLSFFLLFMPLLFLIFISDLPTPNNLSVNYIPKTTKIYDRNGTLLYEIFANQNRTAVKLSEIPLNLRRATVAIEDKDFYSHPGFDIRGIARAFVADISGKSLQGGSTITQQLIKSALLTSDPTINRKLREVVLAFWAERVYSKDQILEMYFNYVPYGGTAWGVEAASEIYFGTSVDKLDLAQSAFLAGLPRAPSVYSPYSGNGKEWKIRQREVLDAMVRDKYITSTQRRQAYAEKLTFKNPDVPIKAPHFVMYVKDLLEQKYGISEVERGGLKVTTTLDYTIQKKAEEVVKENVDDNAYLNISNGAALVTNPSNGDILAMVGSRDYFDSVHDGNVNLTTSLRQPGSTIKIVTYSLALSSGFTESTILDDSPLTIPSPDGGPSYSPVNYDGTYHGKVPLRIAFANSLNIPAVRTAQKLGVDNIVNWGKKMGITTWGNPNQYGLSITLGSGDTTMVDMATVYGTIANQGKRINLDPILEIQDANGKTIYKKDPQGQSVVDPGVAFIISDILADNNARSMEFGPNSPLSIPGHRVSVKTGTTDEKRDNWTIGYTKDYLVATWVGNNDNSPMSQSLASGITGAAPMWHEIMSDLLENKTDPLVQTPGDVVSEDCNGKTAYYLQGTEQRCSTAYTSNPTPPSYQ